MPHPLVPTAVTARQVDAAAAAFKAKSRDDKLDAPRAYASTQLSRPKQVVAFIGATGSRPSWGGFNFGAGGGIRRQRAASHKTSQAASSENNAPAPPPEIKPSRNPATDKSSGEAPTRRRHRSRSAYAAAVRGKECRCLSQRENDSR
jgi:hypothetical protein